MHIIFYQSILPYFNLVHIVQYIYLKIGLNARTYINMLMNIL